MAVRSTAALRAEAPALAEVADVLSGQLQINLERFARLLEPHAAGLERQFLERLQKSQHEQRQRKALAAITPGAAARILARGSPIADFFEQVEYSGRRLAKLNLSPGEVVRALGEYDALLSPILRELDPRDHANFQWSREQLHFCVILTLNNTYYQVREAETQAFYELFHAEVESEGLHDFLQRFVKTLVGFSRAEAGNIFLLDAEARRWSLKAHAEKGDAETSVVTAASTRGRTRLLSRPRYFEAGDTAERILLDPAWANRYQAYWSVPLTSAGRLEGVMQFGFSTAYEWLPRELDLLSSAGKRCLRAVEKVRLSEALARREGQVRELAKRMLQIEEVERRRVSRELHDEAGQSLLCVRMQLEMLEQSVPGEFRQKLSEVRELVETTIREIRRIIGALSPAVLEQLGLAAALRQLVSRFSQVHAARVWLVLRADELPKEIEAVVYRLVQEYLNNAARHSQAAHVNLSLTSADKLLTLRVEDDGVGFDVQEALSRKGSFGLVGMRERVALLGGRMEIQSSPGNGTKIQIALPIPRE